MKRVIRSYVDIIKYKNYCISSLLHNDNDNINAISSMDIKKMPKNFVELVEDDIEEKFVRGSGPGGQATNKTNNCVQLKHTPTGIIVQCHETRELSANRKIARKILKEKLDYLINGDDSKIARKIAKIKKRKYNAQRRAKKKYHSGDNTDDSSTDDDDSNTDDSNTDDSNTDESIKGSNNKGNLLASLHIYTLFLVE